MSNVSMINGHIDEPKGLTDEVVMGWAKECIDPLPHCEICPFDENADTTSECMMALIKKLLDIINRLKADKEALIKGQESLMKHLERKKEIITELDNEVEELSYRNKELLKDVHYYHDSKIDSIKRAKSEAIKQFAEKIYRFFCKTSNWNNLKSAVLFNGECDWLKENLDNLVKEMTESDSNDKAFWEDTN